MKNKSLILMAVAVGCGLVAMLGVQQVLSSNKEGQTRRVKVLTAKTDIDPGVPLTDENSGFREVPIDTVTEGVITKAAEFAHRASKQKVYAGQQIMLSQLGDKGVFGPSINIPEGMRVVTAPVNETMTHSGLIRPGDRVDVLVTYKRQQAKGGYMPRTLTILEYVEVFAADAVRIGTEEVSADIKSKNVSLLVTPRQASIFILAKELGTLSFSLRPKMDSAPTEKLDIDETRLAELTSELSGASGDRPVSADHDRPEPKEPVKATLDPSFRDFLAGMNHSAPPVPVEEPARPTKTVLIFGSTNPEPAKFVFEQPVPEDEQRTETTMQPVSQSSAAMGMMGAVTEMFVGGGSKPKPTKSKRTAKPVSGAVSVGPQAGL